MDILNMNVSLGGVIVAIIIILLVFLLFRHPYLNPPTHCSKGHKLEEYDHQLYCPICNKEAFSKKS